MEIGYKWDLIFILLKCLLRIPVQASSNTPVPQWDVWTDQVGGSPSWKKEEAGYYWIY